MVEHVESWVRIAFDGTLIGPKMFIAILEEGEIYDNLWPSRKKLLKFLFLPAPRATKFNLSHSKGNAVEKGHSNSTRNSDVNLFIAFAEPNEIFFNLFKCRCNPLAHKVIFFELLHKLRCPFASQESDYRKIYFFGA